MRKTKWTVSALSFGMALLAPVPVIAQDNPAHTHIGHISESFGAAPEAQGLMPTASAEAGIAAQHAALAARDPANLDAMKTHAGHVLNALDPTEVEQGPGQGFGVKRAADAVATHIGMASSAGASDNVTTHAAHVSEAAQAVVARTEQAIGVARQIQSSSSAAEAAPLVEQLSRLTAQIREGVDVNGDGRIGWGDGEGGLAQVEQHMGLMRRGEGLN